MSNGQGEKERSVRLGIIGLVLSGAAGASIGEELHHETLVLIPLQDTILLATVRDIRVPPTVFASLSVAVNVLPDADFSFAARILGVLDHGVTHRG